MIDSTINKVYHKARELHDKKRIDSDLWYAILEMKDAHIREIDFGNRPEYFNERDEIDCRDCKEYRDCPCGKDGHESGTSQGYSIGECKDFEPLESEVE